MVELGEDIIISKIPWRLSASFRDQRSAPWCLGLRIILEGPWFIDFAFFYIQLMSYCKIQPPSVVKTFVFENEGTQQSTFVDHELRVIEELVNLNPLLGSHCPLSQHQVSIYDPRSDKFESLSEIGLENGVVFGDMLEPEVILVRFVPRGAFLGEEE